MTAISGFEIVPYTDEALPCPKCSGFGGVNRYATCNAYARGGHGELVNTSYANGLEHLVVRCSSCGWEWLMHPKDAMATGGVVSRGSALVVGEGGCVWPFEPLEHLIGDAEEAQGPPKRPWWRRK